MPFGALESEAGDGVGGDQPPVRSMREAAEVFREEMRKQWKVAGPVALTVLCNYMVYTVTYIFVAHLGEVELSAVAVSFSVIGFFTFGVLLGMGSALETLCGQAYGAGELKMLGIYMQRGWITLWVTCILLLPLYLFAAPLFKLLGQPRETADLAGKFNLLVIPRMFSQATSFPASKFLQAQSKTRPIAFSAILGLASHVALMWLFVSRLRWGLYGVAVAYNASYWTVALVQVVYVMLGCKEMWGGWCLGEAMKGIWGFVRLSAESGVMLCLELWNSMSLVLLSGHLPNALIAAASLSISLNINGYEVMLFVGMSAAVSVRVANELGLGHPRAAKYSIYVTAFQSIVVGLIFMVFIFVTRNYLPSIFTSDKELQHAVSSQAWLLGFTMILNVHIVLSGIATGAGWQGLLAYINFACYFIFGMPLGVILCYKAHLGVPGLWGGMLAGLVLQISIILLMLHRTNWNREVEETVKRVRKWGGEDINSDNIAA